MIVDENTWLICQIIGGLRKPNKKVTNGGILSPHREQDPQREAQQSTR